MGNSITYKYEKMCSKIPFNDYKIGAQHIEQIENRLCGFNIISLTFIMVIRGKGHLKELLDLL